MKSKVTIDVDYDNQPVIKIEYQHSDDVRDTLIKKFLETFGSMGRWCDHTYLIHDHVKGNSSVSILRPVKPFQLEMESKEMLHHSTYVTKELKPGEFSQEVQGEVSEKLRE